MSSLIPVNKYTCTYSLEGFASTRNDTDACLEVSTRNAAREIFDRQPAPRNTLDGLYGAHSPFTLLNAKPSPRNNPRRPLWGPTAYLLYNAVAAQ